VNLGDRRRLEVSKGLVMPGALCVLNASNTSVGRCNVFPCARPDLNLLFDISFLLIALSYASHR
jgi:hypothetical protein